MPDLPDKDGAAWAMRHAGADEAGRIPISEWMLRSIAVNGFQDYIWVEKAGRNIGHCTACGQTVEPPAGRHRETVVCPACGRTVEKRYERYGHKRLRQEFYAVEWRRSAVDGAAIDGVAIESENTIVMIGIYCGVDYGRELPWTAQKLIMPVVLNVFRAASPDGRRKGVAARWKRVVWDYGGEAGSAKWYRQRDVRPLGAGYFGRKVELLQSERNFRDVICGTAIGAGWKELQGERLPYDGTTDHCLEISNLVRRPWLEYLHKAGFEKLARSGLLNARYPKGLINPRGKRVREVLRLSADRFAEMKGKRIDPGIWELQLIQLADAGPVHIKLETLMKMAGTIREWNYEKIRSMAEWHGGMDAEMLKYLRRHETGLYYDYMVAAHAIGMDLRLPGAAFPPDLGAAHDRAVAIAGQQQAAQKAEAQYKRNAALDAKLIERLPKLKKEYCFSYAGKLLRPVESIRELVNEGAALEHCVGSYCESYASGRTIICVLRREDAPDVPWRTIEFSARDGQLVQDRGYKNDGAYCAGGRMLTMTPELKAELAEFWAAFEAGRKLSRMKKFVA